MGEITATTAVRLAKAYGWLCVEIWLLIALGGGVRAMNAGLACPDWPLCFGDYIPDYHPQVYFEFLHRVMAGMVALVSFALAILVWRSRLSRRIKWLSVVSLIFLAAQIILGGLTVILLLHEKVVVAHLLLAGIFLMVNLWLYISLKGVALGARARTISRGFSIAAWTTFVIILSQMTLGGLVASNYAALVCTDFPLCHGKFIPTLKGILGLHVMHRLGAYLSGLAVLLLAFWAWREKDRIPGDLRPYTSWMAALVVLQIVVGILNVIFYTPPLMTVLHLATGMALLGLSAVLLMRLKLSFPPKK